MNVSEEWLKRQGRGIYFTTNCFWWQILEQTLNMEQIFGSYLDGVGTSDFRGDLIFSGQNIYMLHTHKSLRFMCLYLLSNNFIK